MNVLVFDAETTVQRLEDDTIDNSPYNKNNKLVSANWRKITNFKDIGEDNHSVFYHNEYDGSDSPKELQDALDWADILVAHNAKYDVAYLLECGFRIPDKVWCTMIGEYILARGVTVPLSLSRTAIRRNTTHKKSHLVDELFKSGTGFEAMPLPIVLEYADADVLSCAEIFIQQYEQFHNTEPKGLLNIVDLMNEMLLFLVEIERNGIKIDVEELEKVKEQYTIELDQLEKDLSEIAYNVMGDTPINLRSGADISKIVFSREVTDRDLHKNTFNIGLDFRGKPKFPPRMKPTAFANAIRTTTRILKKTKAEHCVACNGVGSYYKTKKDGDRYKKPTTCGGCDGRGYVLTPLKEIAGLKLVPNGPADASIHGFAVDKSQISVLIAQAIDKGNDVAVEFLTKKKRLNAVNTYLSSFVVGTQRWLREDNIVHAKFNQCIAKTGRLSSSDPNLQNQPKDKKFPIRKTVISRFDGGSIMEVDFSGLEFVVAGELSQDPQIISDILDGKDIHRQTGSIVLQKDIASVTGDERGSVKPHTFAPLYGATGNNQPSHIKRYYKEFFNIYKRHGEWQVEQMDSVLTNGFIRTPSGREYMFPGTERLSSRRTTNATSIVNYPVQGFATGDIVPLACIRAFRKFKELGLKSLLILTVHDSIVVDCHPDEVKICYKVLKWATEECVEEIKEKWGYEFVLPLKSEVSIGVNWGSVEAVKF